MSVPSRLQAEQRLRALAAAQRGLFTQPQAVTAGWSRQRLHRWVGSARLDRFHPGVYGFVGRIWSWEHHLPAAVLAAGAGAVASHRSAMALHAIAPASRDPSTSIEVSIPFDRHARLRRVTVHRVLLPPEHIIRVDRIPCTTYARTLVDSAATLGLAQLARGLDQGLVTNQVTLGSVRDALSTLGPAPGRRRARLALLLDERAPGSDRAESRPEIRLLAAVRAAGLPDPVPQYGVTIDGNDFRFDAAYPEARIGIEDQGWDPHRSRTAFDADHRRDRLLTLAGWSVLYFTSASPTAEVVEHISRLLSMSRQG